jgi:FkbM family methyltransferase
MDYIIPLPFKLVNGRYGTFLINTNDLYVGKAVELYGEYGEQEIALFRQIIRSGQTVLDIGANIGTHTVFFARLVGPHGTVHAFEPQRIIWQQLAANIMLNGLLNVHSYHLALGEHTGTITVPLLDYYTANNFGGVSMQEQGAGETVSLQPLDDLNLPACHFIKIDVEGMEKLVLSGSIKTIEKYRPILYVENDRKDKSAELIKFLFNLKYDLYWHMPRLYNPDNFCHNPNNIYGNTISINMLCLPAHHGIKIEGLHKVESPEDWYTNCK